MSALKIYHFEILFSFIFIFPIIFCNAITMKFKGEEKEDYFINQIEGRDCPDQIIIDDKLISYKTCKYKFPNKIVTIKLKWQKNINNFYRMFSDLFNIIEVDLTKFNTSSVYNMSYMFENCKTLIFANLSNLELSSIINMDYMFSNCISLKSLDLTNVDKSKIYNSINLFFNCAKLKNNKILNEYYNNFKFNKYKKNFHKQYGNTHRRFDGSLEDKFVKFDVSEVEKGEDEVVTLSVPIICINIISFFNENRGCKINDGSTNEAIIAGLKNEEQFKKLMEIL